MDPVTGCFSFGLVWRSYQISCSSLDDLGSGTLNCPMKSLPMRSLSQTSTVISETAERSLMYRMKDSSHLGDRLLGTTLVFCSFFVVGCFTVPSKNQRINESKKKKKKKR